MAPGLGEAPPAPQFWGEKHPWFPNSIEDEATIRFVNAGSLVSDSVNNSITGLFLPP
jgi:hypothetical protein